MTKARPQSSSVRYLCALGCTAVALGVRFAIDPFVGTRLPYAPAYLAVLIAARFFGVGPSVLTAILGWAGSSILTGITDWFQGIPYFVGSALVIWFIEVQRRGHAEAEENARIAEDRLRLLREESTHRAREERTSAQLRAVVESTADAIVSKTLDGAILSWNHGAEEVFGYTAAEALGRPMSILLPADRQDEEIDIMERIRRGGTIKQLETVRLHKDGRQIHVSLTISPVRDSAGSVVGLSQIARDITERRLLEDHLRQTQKLESLGVLAGGLAHDFNNLLTGIMGNASLAMGGLSDEDPARDRMSEILQASERAAMLVRQMLAYAGKGQFIVESLNLSSEISDIVPLLRTSISRRVHLDLQLDPGVPTVNADRAQMHQLIMNLAMNAAEAIGDQPGVVSIRTFGRDSDFERQTVIEVSDTGQGMDTETQTRIFDPFFTTKFTGRGLGLAAVTGIIRTHGGTISVQSALGQGSTFIVVLPGTDASGKPTPSSEPQIEMRGYGSVLVVDDEELIRNMARFTLERYGYTVELAENGRAAVEEFAQRPADFAAVLLDLTMPVMSGEEALDRIQEIRPDVPVVLSSGYTESEAVQRFRNRRLAGFLQKPYTATALARKVKRAVRVPGASSAAASPPPGPL